MDYGCYNRDSWTFGEPNGCNIALKLTYSFSYSKKTKRDDITVDKSTKDTILRGGIDNEIFNVSIFEMTNIK